MIQVFRALKGVSLATSLAVTAIILIIDLWLPLGVTVSALYVIPMIISLLSDDRRLTLGLAFLCSILAGVGTYFSPHAGVPPWIVLSNRLIVQFLIWATAFLGIEVTKAKEQIRELGRLLTICAWTKQIKIDDQWISVEDYLTQYHKLRLTHGVSKEAAEKLLSELKVEVR
jgi:hypothetical protein